MLSLVFAALLAVGAPSEACRYDKVALLARSPARFDQDMAGGWRPLADKPGCEGAAADLLAAYRKRRWGTLKPRELQINSWHEGQLRAELGQTDVAVRLLMAGVGPESSAGFEDYALGTVAFLHHERGGLTAAIDRLRTQPEPSDWKGVQSQFKARFGRAPAWPPNLNVLEGLLACFDKSYKEAYGSADCHAPGPLK